MNYQTIFDAGASAASQWPLLIFGASFVLIGISICAVAAFLLKSTKIHKAIIVYVTALGGLMAVSALVWSSAVLKKIHTEREAARVTLISGRVSVVTGPITNFRPEVNDLNSKKRETFTVQGVTFYYSRFLINGGFNDSLPFGGAIRNGTPVRVFYNGNHILKLQIGKAASPS